jgi:hypothetical protein
MTDTVRCPACRGAKKVPKLGGMIGECNTCSGKGTILAVDKPKPVIVEPVESQADIIKAVAEALPVSTFEPVALPEEPQIKIDGKKALYKRKAVAK